MSDPNVVAVEPALYGADQIKALSNIEGIRTRPAMYIGDTGPRGLHHLVYEVVDNCIDEALSGYGKLITVQINLDGSVTTADQGRGIPVGPMPDQGNKPALEVVLTSTHAGGKFDRKGGYSKGTGGLHGVGIKAVNALSEWLEVERRDLPRHQVPLRHTAKAAARAGVSQLGRRAEDRRRDHRPGRGVLLRRGLG